MAPQDAQQWENGLPKRYFGMKILVYMCPFVYKQLITTVCIFIYRMSYCGGQLNIIKEKVGKE